MSRPTTSIIPDEVSGTDDIDDVWARATEIAGMPEASFVSMAAIKKALDESDLNKPLEGLITNKSEEYVLESDDGYHLIGDHLNFDLDEYLKWRECVVGDPQSAAYGVDLDEIMRPLGLQHGEKFTLGKWDRSVVELPTSSDGNVKHNGETHEGNVACQTVSKDHKLVVIDVDDPDFDTSQLPDTLVTRSRSRTGTHHWYLMPENVEIPDVRQGSWGEMQCERSLALLPGSYVPVEKSKLEEETAEDPMLGRYTVDEYNPVREFRLWEFEDPVRTDIWETWLDEIVTDRSNVIDDTKTSNTSFDGSFEAPDGNVADLYYIDMQTVIDAAVQMSGWWGDRESLAIPRIPASGESPQIKHPVHGCDSVTNTGFYATDPAAEIHEEDDIRIQCWRCGVQMDPVGLLATIDRSADIIRNKSHSCEINYKMDRSKIVTKAWVNAHRLGILPDDDKIPSGVIEQSAIDFFDEDEIEYGPDGMLTKTYYIVGRNRARKVREKIRNGN